MSAWFLLFGAVWLLLMWVALTRAERLCFAVAIAGLIVIVAFGLR